LIGFACALEAAQVMSGMEKRPMSTYGLPARGAFGKLFWQGWLTGLIEVSAVVGLIAAFHGYSFGKLAEHGVIALRYGVSWAVVSVVASLFAEFIFRGYMQYTLADGIGFWPAAEVLSALFAWSEVPHLAKDWIGALILLTVGLFWCLTLRRTGSLWFAVGMHASFTFGGTFLFSASSITTYPVEGHLSNAILPGPVWLTGGAVGPEGSVLRFLTIGMLFLAINKLYPAKAGDTLTGARQKKGYLRSPGWQNFVFVCALLVVALGVKHFFYALPVSEVSHFEQWKDRPKLDPVVAQMPERRVDPCLFIVPPGASNQPIASGSIGECLALLPDGRRLDLYEVNLWWGNFAPIKTDLYVPGFMPLAFTRTHTADNLAIRDHRYFRNVYDPYFFWRYDSVEWYLPDGVRINYERNSFSATDDHPSWSQGHYDTLVPLPMFRGSRANWTGSGWDLSLQDGTTYLLDPKHGWLAGIFDENANEIYLTRKSNGELTEITSPNGKWIRFSQQKGLLSRATDSLGDSVNYIYDERGRLKRMTDSRGDATEYEYNSFSHIAKIVDSKGSKAVEIGYDPDERNNKVVQVSLPDGGTFHIAYFLDRETGAGYVDITDPKGKKRRVTMNPKPGKNDPFYTVKNPTPGLARR
jgi:hypothetical protein